MMSAALLPARSDRPSNAALAFDALAPAYDQSFTDTLIGRAQREAVWRVLDQTFTATESILELNCGTGEDAFHLAKRGNSVLACDASRLMIETAESRLAHHSVALPVVFCHLPTERIGELRPDARFDGVFSNFSGLNCVEDLAGVAASLAGLVGPEGQLLLCFSTRFCLVEIVYYTLHGQWQKAFRRCGGQAIAKLGPVRFPIYYPTLGQIRADFAPYFELRSYAGIGVAVPPSYCENWVRRHPRLFNFLRRVDGFFARTPLLRVTGDHMLLSFGKVSA